ncbi:MAG: acetyl-CoA C-acyltransferase [Cyclobacteriaceae bacterium]|nr:acetyl-CoA C-acyltransferase [Cyclobacteriaceae bacterium]
MNKVCIVSAKRTPIGSFGGAFSSLTAIDLGKTAIKGAVDAAGIAVSLIDEVFMGNVIAAGLGQAPARQAALGAGIGHNVPCTTINKVCASGMKAIALGAQSIMLGHNDVVVAGGMESMTNIPYYLPKARYGYGYGNGTLVDGLMHDGLWEAYNSCAMGNCADHTAKEMNISREHQDEYAISSYKRAAAAWKDGKFNNEVVSVSVPQRKGDPLIIVEDEEYKKVQFEKLPALRPVFNKDGTVTAANASTINDGACALVLMNMEKAEKEGFTPLAEIIAFADAARDPMWFTTAPALAIPLALKRAGIPLKEVAYFEINEAFSAVALANNIELGLDPERVNVNGGAVALGHPLGASGARIVTTLLNVLEQNNATIGVAGICNGGGGASAMVIKRV